MPAACALGIFSGKFILYFRDSGTPAGVPLSHFHGRRSCSAAPRFRRKRRCECRFQPRPTCENGIPERPQTLRYSEIINIFSLAYAQSASGGHSKSSRPERGAAFSGSYRCSRPCRRGRHESRSCGPPRGRGGCSGRWGQRPACRQDKPPQRCRRRR